MQEVTIQYSNPKTLKFLIDISKHLDFVISSPKEVKTETMIINGVTMMRGKGKVNNAEMEKIFTKNNIDAKELRSKWQRTK